MKSYSKKYTRLQEGIFRELCKTAGKRINQAALARRLGVTSAAVAKALPRLEDDSLVIVAEHPTMKLKEIELDRENHMAVALKRVENLRSLYVSGLVDFLAEKHAGCTVILFGSYGKGEDTAGSDVDIAIVGGTEKRLELQDYEDMLERPVRIMFVRSLPELSGEFRENLFNGIVLAGNISL